MCVAHGTGGASRTDPEGIPKKWRTGNDTKETRKAHRTKKSASLNQRSAFLVCSPTYVHLAMPVHQCSFSNVRKSMPHINEDIEIIISMRDMAIISETT